MTETWRLLQIVLPVFLIIGVGYLMRRARILTAQADESLLGVLVTLFIPCLALDAIVGNEALLRPSHLLLPPLAGFLSVAVGIGIAWLVGRSFLADPTTRRTFTCIVGLQNYGYIPLPLCQAIFGQEVVGVLFAFNLGAEIAMWSLGVLAMTGGRGSARWWEPLCKPPILSVVVALFLNLCGGSAWIPSSVDVVWHLLGLCAVPVALLLSGALLADYAIPHVLRMGWGVTLVGVGVRMLVLPTFLLLAAFLFTGDVALRQVLIVQAAMPSAIFPIVLTRIHKGDVPTALRIVLVTSAIGLFSIPCVLAWGLRLVAKG